MNKRVVLARIAVFLSAVFLQTVDGRASTVDRIVAVVNGEIITASDLRAAAVQAHLGFLGPATDPKAADRASSERDVLEQLIDKTLQLQTARRLGISVEPDEIDRALADVRQRNNLTTDAAFQNALKEEWTGLDQYREGLKDQITILKLINREVKSAVVLGDAEIRGYYEVHADRFMTPTQYHLHQIFLPIPSPDSASSVEQTARDVVEQLRNGAEFQSMVQRHSTGPDVKNNGDVGILIKDQMRPEIQRAIEHLAPGEISEPVKTSAGIHIFRLDDVASPQARRFEEVKQEIRDVLYQERSAELYEKWLKNLRDAAHVEIRF